MATYGRSVYGVSEYGGPPELLVRGSAAPATAVGRAFVPSVLLVRGVSAVGTLVGRVTLPSFLDVRGAAATGVLVGRAFLIAIPRLFKRVTASFPGRRARVKL